MSPVADPDLAPGSVVIVRDEEWFVRATEETADGLLVHVQGLGELVRDMSASFYASLDAITPLDPAAARVVSDASPRDAVEIMHGGWPTTSSSGSSKSSRRRPPCGCSSPATWPRRG